MSAPPALAWYRALLRLYPRRFRAEYGPDMALLFADQLRDEAAVRVWTRALVDVAITVPTQHLEAHMNRPASPLVPLLFVAVSLTSVIVALIAGIELVVDGDASNRGAITVSLSIAAVAAALAVASWRHTRPVATASSATAHWWKFLAGGAGIVAAVIIAATAAGEVPGTLWWPMMITLLGALMLAITGLVLGVAHLAGNRRATTT